MNNESYVIKLTNESKNALLKRFSMYAPSDWKILGEYIMLSYGAPSAMSVKNFINRNMNAIIQFSITELGISSDAIAVKVTGDFYAENRSPHITIAIPINGDPINSNKIFTWNKLRKELVLSGIVTKIVM